MGRSNPHGTFLPIAAQRQIRVDVHISCYPFQNHSLLLFKDAEASNRDVAAAAHRISATAAPAPPKPWSRAQFTTAHALVELSYA